MAAIDRCAEEIGCIDKLENTHGPTNVEADMLGRTGSANAWRASIDIGATEHYILKMVLGRNFVHKGCAYCRISGFLELGTLF